MTYREICVSFNLRLGIKDTLVIELTDPSDDPSLDL